MVTSSFSARNSTSAASMLATATRPGHVAPGCPSPSAGKGPWPQLSRQHAGPAPPRRKPIAIGQPIGQPIATRHSPRGGGRRGPWPLRAHGLANVNEAEQITPHSVCARSRKLRARGPAPPAARPRPAALLSWAGHRAVHLALRALLMLPPRFRVPSPVPGAYTESSWGWSSEHVDTGSRAGPEVNAFIIRSWL